MVGGLMMCHFMTVFYLATSVKYKTFMIENLINTSSNLKLMSCQPRKNYGLMRSIYLRLGRLLSNKRIFQERHNLWSYNMQGHFIRFLRSRKADCGNLYWLFYCRQVAPGHRIYSDDALIISQL